MKLIVKTLNGKQLPIEIEDTQTVAEIKAIIEKDHALKAETLKLIYQGKVLDSDEKKASDYNLKDGDFFVAMQQKAKPAPKPKPAEEAKVEDPVPGTTTTTAAAANPSPAPSQPAQPAPATASASTGAGAAAGGGPGP